MNDSAIIDPAIIIGVVTLYAVAMIPDIAGGIDWASAYKLALIPSILP